MATLSSPTLQQLLSEVRGLLNQRDPSNSFWTDSELTNYLNDAIALYFLDVVQGNEGYFTTMVDLDITANVDTVALPSDFFQVKALYKKVSNGYNLLPYRNNVLESYSTQGGTSSDNYTPFYLFQGNNLLLRPLPNFSETAGLRLEYIQFPTTLVYGGDAVTAQIAPIFKQVLVMFGVYKAKLKESLVNGVNVHAAALGELSNVVKVLNDSIQTRSKNPTFVIPFNPEFGGF